METLGRRGGRSWVDCFMKGAQDIWTGILNKVCLVLATVAIAVVGATARGDWILILIHFIKAFGDKNVNGTSTDLNFMDSLDPAGWNDKLGHYYLQNVHIIVALSVLVSFVTYYSLAGGLQWYYYIQRRDKPEEWKCQPEKFLSREDEAHEILLGSMNMALGGTMSGILATYIMNGGPCTMYFSLTERGIPYVLFTLVVLFIWEEAVAYYLHRVSHTPLLYRLYHKMHHRYHQPTAFSTTAMHPFEFMSYQLLLMVPPFIIPVYSGAYILSALYIYYYGMMDHSGIMMDAVWPWQPPTIFHDDHHRYFHVNFGFNSYLFDWLHGTIRNKDRQYGEDVFGGKGKIKSN